MVISSQTSSDALFSFVQCELEKKIQKQYLALQTHYSHI